ncbi:unnamed protein product [Calicophoron daubneyi]|uniref:NADH dehydrogenase [ubiquinone] 1 beta subcomplex subunit 4 n=1 Tax=Calicophoron daubneyi TaxID=300641 RepID=A0AAV2TSH4_CALDB
MSKTSTGTPFDPWRTFHESPEEQAAIKERARYRDAMKAEYRKKMFNPFKPPTGSIHDPALQRWYSARVTYAEYLQPSPKGALLLLGFFGFFGTIYYFIGRRRFKVLDKIEKGEISYHDRALKYIGK